jgi:mRNA-degrading endonuclease RelE of RelBE toxin-antitoxin system
MPERAALAAIEYVYTVIASNPARSGHPLRFELEGLFSARRGDHRIVYRFDGDARTVEIVAIEHRADVYRRR